MVSPVYVALDTTDLDRAVELALLLAPHTAGVKLGLEFYTARGRTGLQRVIETGAPLFLDLKLHDIPNTVEKAIRALAGLPVSILTIHAAGGAEMVRRAVDAADYLADQGQARPLVVAVTVLTSLDAGDVRAIGFDRSPESQAVHLAQLAQGAGADGVVCSAYELQAIRRACGEEFVTVVPGIRPAGVALGDQKRAMTPRAAVEAGAHYLVIGRPITQATNPVEAAEAIAREIAG